MIYDNDNDISNDWNCDGNKDNTRVYKYSCRTNMTMTMTIISAMTMTETMRETKTTPVCTDIPANQYDQLILTMRMSLWQQREGQRKQQQIHLKQFSSVWFQSSGACVWWGGFAEYSKFHQLMAGCKTSDMWVWRDEANPWGGLL